MKMNHAWTGCAIVACSLPLASCNSGPDVQRVDPEQTIDLNYRFDDEDARQVFEGMVKDILARPWLSDWSSTHDGRPYVVLGTVRNETQDYIDADNFTYRIQEELVNSGKVRVKAAKDLRADLRDERLDTAFNDPATVKAVAKELNADYMLVGRIGDVKERSFDNKQVVIYYQVNMQLFDVETGELAWGDTVEIKKLARRG